MPDLVNYFKVLGVLPIATPDQIREKYHQIMKHNHPDNNGDIVKEMKALGRSQLEIDLELAQRADRTRLANEAYNALMAMTDDDRIQYSQKLLLQKAGFDPDDVNFFFTHRFGRKTYATPSRTTGKPVGARSMPQAAASSSTSAASRPIRVVRMPRFWWQNGAMFFTALICQFVALAMIGGYLLVTRPNLLTIYEMVAIISLPVNGIVLWIWASEVVHAAQTQHFRYGRLIGAIALVIGYGFVLNQVVPTENLPIPLPWIIAGTVAAALVFFTAIADRRSSRRSRLLATYFGGALMVGALIAIYALVSAPFLAYWLAYWAISAFFFTL